MKDSSNKTYIFGYLAKQIVNTGSNDLKVVTKEGGCKLVTKTALLEIKYIAITKMLIRSSFCMPDMLPNIDIKSVIIKSCDTNILTVAVSTFPSLQASSLEKLWVEIGIRHSVK
jgi:hypothetical protein